MKPPPARKTFLITWLYHVGIGTLAAAFAHSVVQFAYSRYPPGRNLSDVGLFLVHLHLGILFGAIVLIPCFSLQALASWFMSRMVPEPAPVFHGIMGAVMQSVFVAALTAVFPIEPSLSGNFRLVPVLIIAAAIVGFVVGMFSASRRGS